MLRAIICLAHVFDDPDCPLCDGTGVIMIDDGTDESQENELDAASAEEAESEGASGGDAPA